MSSIEYGYLLKILGNFLSKSGEILGKYRIFSGKSVGSKGLIYRTVTE